MIATRRADDSNIDAHAQGADDELEFKERYPELAEYVPRLLGTVGACWERQKKPNSPTITDAYRHIFDEHCVECWAH